MPLSYFVVYSARTGSGVDMTLTHIGIGDLFTVCTLIVKPLLQHCACHIVLDPSSNFVILAIVCPCVHTPGL